MHGSTVVGDVVGGLVICCTVPCGHQVGNLQTPWKTKFMKTIT